MIMAMIFLRSGTKRKKVSVGLDEYLVCGMLFL
jgi:hypothetical protein